MTPKTKDLVKKLHEQLKPTGWYDLLRVFLVSSDFSDIIGKLESLVDDDLRFTPPVKVLFQPFIDCPLDKLKVVVLADAPWPELGRADGLALSLAPKADDVPVMLAGLLACIQGEFEQPVPGHTNLKRWASQGVLLLNQSLTTQIDRPAKHLELWNPFFNYLRDRLEVTRPKMPWVLTSHAVWHLLEDFKRPGHIFPGHDLRTVAQMLRLVNNDLQIQGQEPILW